MVGLILRLFLILLLCGVGGLVWWKWDTLYSKIEETIGGDPNGEHQPDLETYLTLSGDLKKHRARMNQKFLSASTPEEQLVVIQEARLLLEGALPHLMRCWLGTPWDYNGSAHQPGPDKVACGYFVSSLLQDAGFNVEWGALAQQPSQSIIATFLPSENMTIRVGDDYEEFMDEIQAFEPGVYLVGLDSHVGFLLISENEIRFIHSAGTPPHCVVDQSREDAGTLRRSRYRVIGNLTANHAVLRSWLLNNKFATHRS